MNRFSDQARITGVLRRDGKGWQAMSWRRTANRRNIRQLRHDGYLQVRIFDFGRTSDYFLVDL